MDHNSWDKAKNKRRKPQTGDPSVLLFLSKNKGYAIALFSVVLFIILLIKVLSVGIESIYYEIRLPIVAFLGLLLIAILIGLLLQFRINKKR